MSMVSRISALLLAIFACVANAGIAGGQYVGRIACQECHAEQSKRWHGSHHDLAMQEANASTVLGDFDDASFEHFDVVSRFFTREGKYYVHTDGPDGKMQDYPIQYTFGVYPLQQYLIPFPGGRLQTLDIAWDSRPREQGGQRWFHLHPEQPVPHDDVLHWTGPNLNWNYMCADCHSTNLKKNYDPSTDSYRTSWEELDVSCEACHGPGKNHLEWAAKAKKGDADTAPDKGMSVRLDERVGVSWLIDDKTGKPYRSKPRSTSKEIEVCAPCHSRRSQFNDDFEPGKAFHDSYWPSLLTEGLYYPDGQLLDEVYVYGSFLQSKMHAAGVTCSDCHDPHAADLRTPGDQVCFQCHQYDKYASKRHHFHPEDSPSSSCVECHMPPTDFMGVDARHDHSFRVPRPDLSEELGTPNACNKCHADKTPQWASEITQQWYGKKPRGYLNFAHELHAARAGHPDSKRQLQALAMGQQPSIARATALAGLSAYPAADTMQVIQQGLGDPDPLVRYAGLQALEPLGARERVLLAFPLLEDPVALVRMAAARLLAPVPMGQLPAAAKQMLENAIAEYEQAQLFNAERPESQVNLATLYADTGQFVKAEAAYRSALRLQPRFVPAYVNLAQLFNTLKREREADAVLRQGISQVPDNGDLQHALGLSLVRQNKLPEAQGYLLKAMQLAPENAHYAYVYGLALDSAGDKDAALITLADAQLVHPNNAEILYALVTMNRDAGRPEKARQYADQLRGMLPESQMVENLWRELQE